MNKKELIVKKDPIDVTLLQEQGSCNDIASIHDLTCIISMKYVKLELALELETRIFTLVSCTDFVAFEEVLLDVAALAVSPVVHLQVSDVSFFVRVIHQFEVVLSSQNVANVAILLSNDMRSAVTNDVSSGSKFQVQLIFINDSFGWCKYGQKLVKGILIQAHKLISSSDKGTGSGLGEHPFKGPKSDTRVTETVNSTPPTAQHMDSSPLHAGLYHSSKTILFQPTRQPPLAYHVEVVCSETRIEEKIYYR
ncbi:hypothetical protein Tco_1104111 [Tanacetum coccineum]